jgi:hypothetical protein
VLAAVKQFAIEWFVPPAPCLLFSRELPRSAPGCYTNIRLKLAPRLCKLKVWGSGYLDRLPNLGALLQAWARCFRGKELAWKATLTNESAAGISAVVQERNAAASEA